MQRGFHHDAIHLRTTRCEHSSSHPVSGSCNISHMYSAKFLTTERLKWNKTRRGVHHSRTKLTSAVNQHILTDGPSTDTPNADRLNDFLCSQPAPLLQFNVRSLLTQLNSRLPFAPKSSFIPDQHPRISKPQWPGFTLRFH